MRFPFSVLAIVLTLTFTLSAHHATAKDSAQTQYVKVLAQIHLDPDMRKDMRKSGFKGAQLEVVLDHFKALFSDRDIARYLADRMVEIDQGKRSSQEGLWDWLQPLMDRGLPHLSNAEMAAYLQTDVALLDGMSTANCGRMVKGKGSSTSLDKATTSALARMSPDGLAQYYRIYRAAVKTGLRNSTPPKLSEKTQAAAYEDIMAELDAQIVGHRNYAKFRAALERMTGVSNVIACQSGRYMLQSVLNVRGTNRRAALQLFLTPGS